MAAMKTTNRHIAYLPAWLADVSMPHGMNRIIRVQCQFPPVSMLILDIREAQVFVQDRLTHVADRDNLTCLAIFGQLKPERMAPTAQ